MQLRKNSGTMFELLFKGLAAGLLLLVSVPAGAQLPVSLPPEKVVNVFGQNIHYYEAGQGPCVILLHGLGGEASHWAGNIGPLAEHYHVYALDQIGFGRSDKPLIEYRIQTFVEFLAGFLDALKIPKATLVGNSLGGWISAEFAVQHPDRIDKLVLVDAAGMRARGSERLPIDLNPSSLKSMRQIIEIAVYDKAMVTDALVTRAFENHMKYGDGYTIQRVLTGIFAADQYEDAKAASIHAPTLVLWGHDDALIRLAAGERYQSLIAGAKLVVFDQCGHIPQIERPAEFNKALLDFLARP